MLAFREVSAEAAKFESPAEDLPAGTGVAPDDQRQAIRQRRCQRRHALKVAPESHR